MLNVSKDFKKAILNESKYHFKATITLKSGEKINIDDSNLVAGGFSLIEDTSNLGSFDIGAAMSSIITFSIFNDDESFSDYNFYEAEIVVWIGIEVEGEIYDAKFFDSIPEEDYEGGGFEEFVSDILDGGGLDPEIEWVQKGIYIITSNGKPGATIQITANDRLTRFNQQYDSSIQYPNTIGAIVMDACNRCDVELADTRFNNSTYVISEAPVYKDDVTYLDVLSYCAQLACCYAKMNPLGYLELKWYDIDFIDSFDIYDGGNFLRIDRGDTYDGGTLTSSGNEILDSEGFGDFSSYHHIYALKTQDVSAADITITGIKVVSAETEIQEERVVESNTQEYEDGYSDVIETTEGVEYTKRRGNGKYLYGKEGYVLELSDNPLIIYGHEQEVAEYIGTKLINLSFRILSVNSMPDITVEAGDTAIVTDGDSECHIVPITNITFKLDGDETYAFSAETPSERELSTNNGAVTNVVEKNIEYHTERKSSYDRAIDRLSQRVENASGLYPSEGYPPGGGTIYYFHNRPTMEESSTIWALSDQAFVVTSDGGKTWHGLTVDGEFIAKIIDTIGIRADWIDVSYWERITKHVQDTGTTITNETETKIQNSANQILLTASQTYTTKTETSTLKNELNTSIQTTASQILLTASQTYSTKTETNTIKEELNTAIQTSSTQILLTASQTYTTKTEASQTYSTKTETGKLKEDLESSLSITADQISSKVSKGNVSSEISQEAEDISIESDRIAIKSTNFELSKKGSVTAKDMKITGGSIEFTDTTGNPRIISRSSTSNQIWVYTGGGVAAYSGSVGGTVVAAFGSTLIQCGRINMTASTGASNNIAGALNVALNFRAGTQATYTSRTHWLYGKTYNYGGISEISDRREKKNIEDISGEFSKSLILNIAPKLYELLEETDGKPHFGFIAQDIEEILGFDYKIIEDAKVVIQDEEVDDEGNITNPEVYMRRITLNYNEIIAPLTKVVQMHEEEIVELRRENEDLKSKNQELEEKLNKIMEYIGMEE